MKEKEKYLSYAKGDMDADEQKAFEHELFRNKFVDDMEIILGLGPQKKVRRISIKRKHLLALGVLAMIGMFCIVFFYKPKTLNENIFASYYHPYKNDNSSMYRVTAVTDNFTDAMDLYNKGNYQTAVIQFQRVIQNNTTDLDSHFFIGMSFIELHNYENAIDNLSTVVKQNDIFFINHAKWYLALCYLETKQTSCAISLLNQIANDVNDYQQMAKEILKKIN